MLRLVEPAPLYKAAILDAVAEMQACIVIYDKNVSTQSPSGNIYPILLPQSELASCCSWQSWYSSC
jgi:hypothetical protein